MHDGETRWYPVDTHVQKTADAGAEKKGDSQNG